MTMKKIISIFFVLAISLSLKGQQLPQFTQYMINDYVFNPAVAGKENSYQVKCNIRNQWVGINDAPSTSVLSIFGKYRESNVGLGGVVFSDRVGPTSRTGLSLSYAYHFAVAQDIKASLSLSGGFTQLKLDPNNINFENPNDPLANNGVLNSSVPDATFALYLYSKDWYFGASVPQLMNSKIGFFDEGYKDTYNVDPDGSLERHYYAMAGYKWLIKYDYLLEPSVLIKSVANAPTLADIGLKLTYQDKLWMGTDYRTNGDIGLLLGYSIADRYLIGYSYDMITSNLSNYSSGSHEFMLGIRFYPNSEEDIMKK